MLFRSGFAAQSGGRAEIKSAPGEGTTIRLVLPRTSKAPAAAKAAALIPEDRPSLTVLVVEDNDHVREFATALLEELGYTVLAADCGEAALGVLAECDVDILFSDVVMPGMGGIELATAARGLRPELPVVLASGYSEDIVAGAGAAFDFVRKPYDAEQLGRALRDARPRAPAGG